jgi:Tfp pilus assembly protein PilF
VSKPPRLPPSRKEKIQKLILVILVPVALVATGGAAWEYQRYAEGGRHLALADAYLHQADAAPAERERLTQRAVEELEKCLAVYPYYTQAYEMLASIAYERGDRRGMIAIYKRGVQSLPGNGQLHLELGKQLLLDGNPREALVHCQKAAELLAPGDPEVEKLRQMCVAALS